MPNQLTLRRYGRYRTSPDGDSGNTGSGYMRACVFNAATANVWVTKIAGFLGRASGSNPTVRFACYETNTSMNPTNRVGYTASFSVTNLAGSSPETQLYQANVAQADNAPTNTAFKIQSGKRYAVAYLGTGNTVVHSMVQAANITGDNEQFYDRSGLSQPPPNPFGSYTAHTEGWLTVYLEGWENVAPDAPNLVAPVGSVQSDTPTFVGDFRDLNGAWGASSGNGVDTGDQMNQYQIQVRQAGQTTLLWDATYTASSTEKSNDQFSRAYGGSALTRGTTYEWRARTSDQFGAWGAWSAWTQFTPASLGYVTLNGNPTGKIGSVTPNFEARWTHQNGLSTNAVQIRLETQSGTVLQTSGTITKTVASSATPGTLFTITWGESGFTTLAWGTAYQYRVRGRDTNNQWSNWSDPRTFNTNAAPSIPANLTPTNSQVLTSLPKLRCTASDVDDTTATGLVVKCRIKDNAGTVLQTRTMTYNATTGKWEYQTISADIPSFATYRWDAYSFDGTLYSGEQTVEANAVKSTEAVFVYASGPVVSVTSPADNSTITTVTPTVQWSVTSGGPQAKYRVRIYPNGGSTPLYDTGWVTSTATSHNVPSGYLHNNTAYDLVVSVENTSALQGNSPITDFTVSLTPPPPVSNFQVNAVKVGLDLAPTAIRCTWDATTIPSGQFVEYRITRSATGGPDEDEVIVARITGPNTTAFQDTLPAATYRYTYSIVQVQQQGTEILESGPVYGSAQVTIPGVVLCAVGGLGESLRAVLKYLNSRSHQWVIDETVYPPVAGSTRAPVTFRGPSHYREFSLSGLIAHDAIATARERRQELEDLHASNATICYRDNEGRKIFCRLVRVSIEDDVAGFYRVTVDLREERYTEALP
jgi:LPS sulfotransferase NodH